MNSRIIKYSKLPGETRALGIPLPQERRLKAKRDAQG